jgi:cytochrome c peroxidase
VKSILFTIGVLFSLSLMIGCGNQSQTKVHSDSSVEDFAWNLPAQIPLPILDPDNPMSEAKFQLGRHLFYDQRLSANASMSCSSCHQQDKAFSDGRPLAIGSTGQTHPRNSQGLSNVAYNATLTWANTVLLTVEKQVFVPLFGETPVEHGLTRENWPDVVQRLKADARYFELFRAAYPSDTETFSQAQITKALAVFARGLTSFGSAYDRHLAGDNSGYSAGASRGEKLFFSEKMECFHCHGGYNFSDSTADRTMSFVNQPFHNTGLYNIEGTGRYPDGNRGIFEQSSRASDMGRFRAPSLRNIAKTAPYMHDGSITDLSAVLDFYAAGGRNIESGPHRGDGRKNPYKDGFVTGFTLSEQERRDVIAFLESLTDEEFLTNPRFANPW